MIWIILGVVSTAVQVLFTKYLLDNARRKSFAEGTYKGHFAERVRIVTYLRDQARTAEVVSKCTWLSAVSRDQEAYSSAVLSETADEILDREHWRVT